MVSLGVSSPGHPGCWETQGAGSPGSREWERFQLKARVLQQPGSGYSGRVSSYVRKKDSKETPRFLALKLVCSRLEASAISSQHHRYKDGVQV